MLGSRPMKLRRVLLAAVGSVIVLSGCLEVETKIDVSDDGTADVSSSVLLDVAELEALAGMFGGGDEELSDMSPDALADEMFGGEDPCADVTFDVGPDTIIVEEIDRDGKVGYSCLVEGVRVRDLVDPETGTVMITQTDGVTEIALPFSADDLDLADTDELEMLGAEFTDIFDISFVVSAPGQLVEHNATSTSGSTATWTVTPDAEFLTTGQMTARWESGSSGSGSIIVAVLLVIGIVAAIVVAITIRKRRDTTTPAQPSNEAFPPPTIESAAVRPPDETDRAAEPE